MDEEKIQEMNKRIGELEQKIEAIVQQLNGLSQKGNQSGPVVESGEQSPSHPSEVFTHHSTGSLAGPQGGPAPSPRGADRTININLEDQEEEFVIEADIPGFQREEISMELGKNSLQLSATRKEKAQGRYLVQERPQEINRVIELPEPIGNGENISAEYEDGVLTIHLPKKENWPDSNHEIKIG